MQKYAITGNKQKNTIFENIWKYKEQKYMKYLEIYKICKNMQNYAKICKNMQHLLKYAKYGDSVI